MAAPALAASVPAPLCSSLVTYAMPAGAATVGGGWVGGLVRVAVLFGRFLCMYVCRPGISAYTCIYVYLPSNKTHGRGGKGAWARGPRGVWGCGGSGA